MLLNTDILELICSLRDSGGVCGRDRSAARTAYRQRVSDTHPFGMCGGFIVSS